MKDELNERNDSYIVNKPYRKRSNLLRSSDDSVPSNLSLLKNKCGVYVTRRRYKVS